MKAKQQKHLVWITLIILAAGCRQQHSHEDYAEISTRIISNAAQGSDINRRYDFGWTALHIATMNHKIGYIKAYLKKGANIDAQDDVGRTPLMLAALKGNIEVMSLLINTGCELNKQTLTGDTALTYAMCEDRKGAISLLVRKGADVNVRSQIEFGPKGITPLIWAVRRVDVPLIKELLDHGADPNRADNQGITPLHYAQDNHQSKVVELLRKYTH